MNVLFIHGTESIVSILYISPFYVMKGANDLKKKKLVIIISSAVALTLISGIVAIRFTHAGAAASPTTNVVQAYEDTPAATDSDGSDNNSDYTYIPPTPVEENQEEELTSFEVKEEEPFVPATEMDLDPSSITVFVNKEFALPKDYKPEKLVTPNVVFNLITYDERTLMRPEAAVALEKLFNAAKREGIILYGISGYRSYQRQYGIFTNNIVHKGKKYTLRYSAVPGTSEHQTGLSIDVSAKSLDYKLSAQFSSSPEGIWLAENAYNYGYIIRYPKGNEQITGYAYEPWHIRYVGKGLAKYLYDNKLTLDEYYHYTPSPGFNFEAKYAEIINFTPPSVTGAPAEGEDVIIGEDGEIIDGGIDGTLPVDQTPEDDSNTDPTKGEDSSLPDGDATITPEGDNPADQPTDDNSGIGDDTEQPTDQNPDSELPAEDGTITPTPTPTPTVTPTPTPQAGANSGDISGT